MSPYIVVWLDYTDARISAFDHASCRNRALRSYSIDPAYRADARTRSVSRAPQSAQFFDDIAGHLQDARAVLIVGPGFERLELMMHLACRHPSIAEKVVALETVDHAIDEEMVPWERKHFLNQMMC